eukprot:Pgem_evm1s15132
MTGDTQQHCPMTPRYSTQQHPATLSNETQRHYQMTPRTLPSDITQQYPAIIPSNTQQHPPTLTNTVEQHPPTQTNNTYPNHATK